MFGTVEKLAEAGHDPRRFATDLLDRLRDLVLLRAVPDPRRGLVSAPEEELSRMVAQAERIGLATLSRYADIVHNGLLEMRGATSPRLVLELLCARMLLPSVIEAEKALLARIERLERRATLAGGGGSPAEGGVEPPVRAVPERDRGLRSARHRPVRRRAEPEGRALQLGRRRLASSAGGARSRSAPRPAMAVGGLLAVLRTGGSVAGSRGDPGRPGGGTPAAGPGWLGRPARRVGGCGPVRRPDAYACAGGAPRSGRCRRTPVAAAPANPLPAQLRRRCGGPGCRRDPERWPQPMTALRSSPAVAASRRCPTQATVASVDGTPT